MKHLPFIISTLLVILTIECCSSDYDIEEPGVQTLAIETRSMANELPNNGNGDATVELDTISDSVLWYPSIDSTFVYEDNSDFTLSLHVTSQGGTFESVRMSCNPIVDLKYYGQYDEFRHGAQSINQIGNEFFIYGIIIFIKNENNCKTYDSFEYDSSLNLTPIKIPNPNKKKKQGG